MSVMNNKKLGTEFEKDVCKLLNAKGYWVHFIAPDNRGSQPFDIIAVKDNMATAIECKTLTERKKYFDISRLEENQKLAFDKWMKCGNVTPLIFVKWGNRVKVIEWTKLKAKERIYFESDDS